MLHRRDWMLGAAATALTACRRNRATAFPGHALIANAEGRSVAAVDLTTFTLAQRIALNGAPTQVIALRGRPAALVLTPENGTIHEIDTRRLTLTRSVRLAPSAATMGTTPDAAQSALFLLDTRNNELLKVDPARLTVLQRTALPAKPQEFDCSHWTNKVVVSFAGSGQVGLADIVSGRLERVWKAADRLGPVRFRSDGKQFWAAEPESRRLSAWDTSGRRVTSLPLSVRPDHLCAHPDGGQLFITGEGADAVVVVEPYQTQVAKTVLAGHAPGAMAACPDPQLLFVAMPQVGEVTVLDMETRKVVAVAAVGMEPSFVKITPDNQYALVLNGKSGDLAVIRTRAIRGGKIKTAALFTLIPVGSKPVSADVASL